MLHYFFFSFRIELLRPEKFTLMMLLIIHSKCPVALILSKRLLFFRLELTVVPWDTC